MQHNHITNFNFFSAPEYKSCFAFNHSEVINNYNHDFAWESFLKYYSLKNLYISLMAGNFTTSQLKQLIVVENRVDINQLIDGKETLLHHIVQRLNSRIDPKNVIIKTLLELGAEVNRVNSKGFTPLDIALSNSKEIYDVLRKHGGKHSREIKAKQGEVLSPTRCL